MEIRTVGRLVGLPSNSYDFTNDAGKPVAGTSRAVWLSTSLASEPAQIKVRQDDAKAVVAYNELCQHEFGAEVELICDLSKRGTMTLVSLAE